MFGESWKKLVAVVLSSIVAIISFNEILSAALPLLQSVFPLFFDMLGISEKNVHSISPLVIISLLILILFVVAVNLILWPLYRYLLGNKGGKWFYVVQNVRPRVFDAGEGLQFDALHGLKESKLVGVMNVKDGLFRAAVPSADVHYYDTKTEMPGDFRGSWKSYDGSVSGAHMRFKYSIEVQRKIEGEQVTKYSGYYLLEPSHDVTPLVGKEVWEGVVFTVNQFGGMFGLVYAERMKRNHKVVLSKLDEHFVDLLPSMLKRIRTPSRERYINESGLSPKLIDPAIEKPSTKQEST